MRQVMSWLLIVVVLLSTSFQPLTVATEPQDATAIQSHSPLEVNRESFRRELIRAAVESSRAGEISRRDVRAIRVATISPAFRQAAEDLCVVQLAFAEAAMIDDEGAEPLPRNADGDIDRAGINWEGFASFLIAIMPYIMELLKAFGIGLGAILAMLLL